MEEQQANSVGDDWRSELAFPSLSQEMIERIRPYGREQTFRPGEVLYRCGDVDVGTFIVLEGGIDVTLPLTNGSSKITGRHRKFNFTGEFNLLNSQGAVVQAETICESRLLCVLRKDLQRLMSAEGDIANLIVQAAILRRIAILNETSSGVTLVGRTDDAMTTQLRR
ncbi:MAG TPA: Crp/Fnr family transcriptional regulator, partial [Bryobacteraceae bacterium]